MHLAKLESEAEPLVVNSTCQVILLCHFNLQLILWQHTLPVSCWHSIIYRVTAQHQVDCLTYDHNLGAVAAQYAVTLFNSAAGLLSEHMIRICVAEHMHIFWLQLFDFIYVHIQYL